MSTPGGRVHSLAPSSSPSLPAKPEEARTTIVKPTAPPAIPVSSLALSDRKAAIPATEIVATDFTTSAASTERPVSGDTADIDLPLAVALIQAIRGPTLDLTGISAKTLASMPDNAWSALAEMAEGSIHHVILPCGMTELPDGIEGLGDLRSVLMSGFRGSRVVIPAAMSKTHIGVLAAHYDKIVVHKLGTGTKVDASNLHRHIYLRSRLPTGPGETIAKPNRNKFGTNWNGKVAFKHASGDSGSFIVCRHLCMAWLRERTAHLASQRDAKGEHARFSYEKFSSPKAIGTMISAADEQLFAKIAYHATDNYLIQTKSWSEFLVAQLKGMVTGDDRHFLMRTSGHAMALEFRCKQDPSEQPKYVLNFYDPNITETHLRVVVDHPEELQGWLLDDWNPLGFTTYFNPQDPYALLTRVDPHLLSAGDAHAPLATQAARKLTLLGKQEPSGQMLSHLMNANLSAALELVLAHLPEHPAKRLEVLEACDTPGPERGWFQACWLGHAETIQLMVDRIRDDETLTPAAKAHLLEARNIRGMPGLRAALFMKHGAVVRILVKTILDFDLSPQQKLKLLAARYADSDTAFEQSSAYAKQFFLEPFKDATEAQFSSEARKSLEAMIKTSLPPARGKSDAKSR